MRFLTCLFLVVFMINAFGQEITFERITTKEGLSQNDILGIFQDSEGYMWFGTNDGVNRYDGYDFQVFRKSRSGKNSVSSSLVTEIIEDNNKNIIFATLDAGINIFNLKTERFSVLNNTDTTPNLITSNNVTHLKCLSDGTIYGGTGFGANFIKLNQSGSYNIQKVYNPVDPTITYPNFRAINEVSSTELYIAGAQGFYIYKQDSSANVEWKVIPKCHFKQFKYIESIIDFKNGYIIGHNEGIEYVQMDINHPTDTKATHIHDISNSILLLDRRGYLWAGGANGLYLFKPTGNDEMPFVLNQVFVEGQNSNNLSNGFVRNLYEDKSGIIWIGTNGGGICKYNPMSIKFRHYKHTTDQGSVSANKITDIHEDREHNIWFGTEGGGINVLWAEKEKNYTTGFRQYDVNEVNYQNFVYDLLEVDGVKEDFFLAGVGFSRKLVTIQKKWGGELTISPAVIPSIAWSSFALCQDKNKWVWVATYKDGLYKYLPITAQQGKQYQYNTDNSKLPSNIVRSVIQDSKSRMWIGTGDGLCMIESKDIAKEELICTIFTNNYKDSTTISHNYILPIFESSTGDIWIGTLGGGLNKYIEAKGNKKSSFLHLEVEDGMPNNVVKDIIEDREGMLWVSSNGGLTRLNPHTLEVKNYNVSDGLQDIEFADLSGCILHDGEILFGGVNGFNAFYPNEITTDTTPPKVVFTRLEIYNQTVAVGAKINGKVVLPKVINEINELRLGYKENNFTIHFAGIHFAVPQSNKYKYRLRGYDKDWIAAPSNARFAKYTLLPEGSYYFEVMASNSDGLWTEEPESVTIHISPPYWQTIWFRLLIAFTIVILIILIINYQTYKVKERNIELARLISERTQEVRSQNLLLEDQKDELMKQTVILNETNTQLEERQQIIEEQSEELRAQKETLEETNATKDKFFSIFAHDLKNPFSSLLGYLDLLRLRYDKYDEPKRKGVIETIHNSANLVFKLMENLLQWSRSQRGLMPFTPQNINLKPLLDEEVTSLAQVAEKKGINLVINYPVNEIEVVADDNMLRSVVRNLVSNAIKFTESGGEVKLTIESFDKVIKIAVADTGIGIPSGIVGDMFRLDRHYSTEGTEKERGTGLGLVLCKEFVEKHKGEIWVESELGVGSTFFFEIPNTLMTK